MLLAVLATAACGADEDAGAAPQRIANAIQERRELLCECGDDWQCAVAEEPRVFDCIREILAPQVEAMGNRLTCYAGELEKYARCQGEHGCNDDGVEACIGGDDDPGQACGSFSGEVNEQLRGCYDLACDADSGLGCR